MLAIALPFVPLGFGRRGAIARSLGGDHFSPLRFAIASLATVVGIYLLALGAVAVARLAARRRAGDGRGA